MANTAVKTQGIELYWASAPAVATKALQITSAPSPMGGQRSQIDITNLDSVEHEFVSGLSSPTAETFGFIFDPMNTSHVALIALKTSGLVVPWYLGMSDGVVAPTVASGAFVVTPVARSFFLFSAYVADLVLATSGNDVVKGTITLQRSGATVFVAHT